MLQSASRGGVCSGGGLLPGGRVSAPGGVCLFWGVSAPGGLLWGVSALGVLVGGVSAPGGASQHALRQTPLPPCGQIHACENITLAQLRCGR